MITWYAKRRATWNSTNDATRIIARTDLSVDFAIAYGPLTMELLLRCEFDLLQGFQIEKNWFDWNYSNNGEVNLMMSF